MTATDLFVEQAAAQGWVDTNQHAGECAALNDRGLCGKEAFESLVDFQFVDMNAIPESLERGFDFLWSSCAIDHLGTIGRGKRFVLDAMRLLKPGGIAVHTTEYNVSSNSTTIESGPTVLFRHRDIVDLAECLRRDGHHIDLDFDPGSCPADNFVDLPPYVQSTHLKLVIGEYVCTSIGLIITKRMDG